MDCWRSQVRGNKILSASTVPREERRHLLWTVLSLLKVESGERESEFPDSEIEFPAPAMNRSFRPSIFCCVSDRRTKDRRKKWRRERMNLDELCQLLQKFRQEATAWHKGGYLISTFNKSLQLAVSFTTVISPRGGDSSIE